jgi:excisionase family DNA binding protein
VSDPLTLLSELAAEVSALRSRIDELERDRAGKRWLSVGEAAAYLGTTERAVYMRIRRDRIPAAAVRRSGRSVLIDREVLDRALARA